MPAKKSSSPEKAKKPRFPKKELLTWLKGRGGWNHDDWLGLLDDLRKKGYSAYTECQEGQAEIGNFLEANRGK